LFMSEKKIKSKIKNKELIFHKYSLINLILVSGLILIIISFYSISVIFPPFVWITAIVALFVFLLYAIHSKTWTNLTFKFSNYLFLQKQKLIDSTKKLPSIFLSIYIVILELILVIISLPVYVFIKAQTIKEIKCEKFRLRRKITLIYLGFIIFVILLQTIIAMIILSYIYPPFVTSFIK